MFLAGAVVASWSLTQEVAGCSPFTVMINIVVTEFSEFSETFRKNPLAQGNQWQSYSWTCLVPRKGLILPADIRTELKILPSSTLFASVKISFR